MTMKKFNIADLNWINQPASSSITEQEIVIRTAPDTDFWQGTY